MQLLHLKYSQNTGLVIIKETWKAEVETYEELQAWCEYGINENYDKIAKLYNYEISLNKIYARFHGKIIEFMKRNPKG